MIKDEKGYIVIEAIGAFLPFVFLIISILSLVNIVALQSRIHYAMTETANAISIYAYTLEVTGVASEIVGISERGDKFAAKADDIKKNLDILVRNVTDISETSVDDAYNSASNIYSTGEAILENPKEVLNYIVSSGVDAASSIVIFQPLISRYLTNGEMSALEYLESANVIGGLELSNGTNFLDKDGNIKIVVNYDVHYKFGLLPVGPILPITQTVKTKAWLNGNEKGYENWYK